MSVFTELGLLSVATLDLDSVSFPAFGVLQVTVLLINLNSRPSHHCTFANNSVINCQKGLSLAIQYNSDGDVKVSSSLGHSAEAIKAALTAHSEGDANALALAARHLSLAASGEAQAAHELSKATKSSPADVVSGTLAHVEFGRILLPVDTDLSEWLQGYSNQCGCYHRRRSYRRFKPRTHSFCFKCFMTTHNPPVQAFVKTLSQLFRLK